VTRILLVDDQQLFLESLATVLENIEDDFEVIGMASDGEQAMELLESLQPDIVLMDVRMPVMDGVKACRLIKLRNPGLPILMLTTFEDDEYVREALTHGAAGYLLKNIPPQELVASIKAALSGAVLIDPRVISKLMHNSAAADSGEQTYPDWLDSLSRKEKQILGLIVHGHTNSEIADTVHVAEQTVRNYVSRIYEKLDVRNRVQAIQVARKSGLF
jgi:DNA-binding NarL/FixJ family response regulator